MPSRRFLLALTLSFLFHATVIGLPEFELGADGRRLPVALQARLLPSAQATAGGPDGPILKDTLADEPRERVPADHAMNIAAPSPTSRPSAAVPTHAARPTVTRKSAERRFYPPGAAARGIEGETRLRLTLDAAGRVVSVQIASSSGHPELDQAAVRAARSLDSLPGIGVRELLLPVIFRLQ